MRRIALIAGGVLVVTAVCLVMLLHWDTRHEGLSREAVFGEGLTGREWRSLARLEAITAVAALATWLALGWGWARRRARPWADGLRRTARAFAPGLLAAAGLATNIGGYEKDPARAFEALAVTGIVAALWAAFDLWPMRSQSVEPHGPRAYALSLIAMALLYAGLFAWLSIMRYRTYFAALNDLGMYTQQFWGNLHGHWFLVSGFRLPRDTMLAEHFMPLVAILTPFYAFWPDPKTILILQAVAVAFAAVPLYAIGVRLGLDRRAALLIAACFLLHPMLQVGTLYDFHPDAFVPLFSLTAFWILLALDHWLRRWREGDLGHRQLPIDYVILYALFVLLWLSYKEDAMFGVAMLGFYALVFRRRPVIGLGTMLVAVAWGVLAIGWIIPHFRGEAYAHVDRYYYLVEPYGFRPGEESFFAAFPQAAASHPLDMARRLLTAPRLQALLVLFAPVLFLPLFGPKELLIALPMLALNMLSKEPVQHELQLHYPFTVLPFVYVAAMTGLRNLSAWRREEARNARGASATRRQLVLAAAAFVVAIGMCRMFGETPLSRPFHPERVRRTKHHELADEFLKAVPPAASLTAQTALAAHATHRREIFEFPYLERRPDYVLIDAQMHTWPLSEGEYVKRVRALLEGKDYGVLRAESGLVLLKRGHTTEKNAEALTMIQSRF